MMVVTEVTAERALRCATTIAATETAATNDFMSDVTSDATTAVTDIAESRGVRSTATTAATETAATNEFTSTATVTVTAIVAGRKSRSVAITTATAGVAVPSLVIRSTTSGAEFSPGVSSSSAYCAAVTWISIILAGDCSRAAMQARAGLWPSPSAGRRAPRESRLNSGRQVYLRQGPRWMIFRNCVTHGG